jgi:hypothetical protein
VQISVLGRIGDGPGEFRLPVAAAELPSGQLAVLDAAHSRVSVFSWPGIRDTAWALDGISAYGMASIGDSLVVTYTRVRSDTGAQRDSTRNHVFTGRGVYVRSFWVSPTPPYPYSEAFAGTVMTGTASTVVSGVIGSNQIVWFDFRSGAEGTTRVGVGRYAPPAWPRHPPRDIAEASQWARTQTWLARIVAVDSTRAVAAFGGFDADGAQRLWYALFDINRGDIRITDWTQREVVGSHEGRLLTVDHELDGSVSLRVFDITSPDR